jgi:hypothetical protein
MMERDFYPSQTEIQMANQQFENGELSSEEHLSQVEAYYLGQMASQLALAEELEYVPVEEDGDDYLIKQRADLEQRLRELKHEQNHLEDRNDNAWAKKSNHYESDMRQIEQLEQEIAQVEQELAELNK